MSIQKPSYINQAEAYRYLGYAGQVIDDKTKRLMDETQKQILDIVKPRSIYKLFNIESIEKDVKIENLDFNLEGSNIKEHLKGCEKVILMAVTLSKDIDDLIRTLQVSNITKALMADALASAYIEQICDNIILEIKQKLPNYYLTFRFSPGYGDFPIEIQGKFLSALQTQKKIGLGMTGDTMMVPTKSVTAVVGLSKTKLPKQKQSCAVCNMREECTYRKKGVRCGV